MGYFKEMMMENEGRFYDYIEENGIIVDGISYNDAEVLLSEKPDYFYSALEAFTSEVIYG